MNKTTTIILSFLAIVILGAGVLLFTTEDDQTRTSEQSAEPTVTSSEPVPTTEETERYVTYSEDAIAQAEGEVILFFHAVWCTQCVQLERDLKENGVPAGYTFVEVDFDQNQDLRQRYEVSVQTTLVRIDENGEEVDRHVPFNEPTVDAVMRDFLDA